MPNLLPHFDMFNTVTSPRERRLVFMGSREVDRSLNSSELNRLEKERDIARKKYHKILKKPETTQEMKNAALESWVDAYNKANHRHHLDNNRMSVVAQCFDER